MFGYGSASGLLSDVKSVLDTSKNEKSTAQSKADISSSLSKINSVTVGSYNKAVEEKAIQRKLEEADRPEEIGGLNQSRRDELFARIEEKKKQEYLNANSNYEVTAGGALIDKRTGKTVGQYTLGGTFYGNTSALEEYNAAKAEAEAAARSEVQDLKDNYNSGGMTDDELVEAAGGKDFGWYVTDTMNAVGDSISEGVDWLKDKANFVGGLVQDAFSMIKGGLCMNAPYPECTGCPNRPKLARKKATGGGMGDLLGCLKCGLTSAVNGLLDCPGTSAALVNGDFKKVGGALGSAAISTACSTAASIGSAVVYKGLANLVSSDMFATAGSKLGTLVGNMPGSDTALSACGSVMNKFGVTTKDLFAKGINYGTAMATHKLLASEKAGAGMLAGIINNDPVLAARTTTPQITSLIATGSTRTRCRITSSKLSTLPGGMRVSTLKTSFALENIRSGWNPPKCTRVRRHRSSADVLM